jgi:hypothetical protein
MLSHPTVAEKWRHNHLPLTARIRHSYHKLLQICTSKKWCSGKQQSLVPSGPWFEPMPWKIIFATFRELASADLVKMLTCGTLKLFMTTWNTLFEKMLTCGTQLNFMMTWNTLF